MRKNLLIAGILVSSVAMANGNVIEVRLGGDLKNTYIVENNGQRTELDKSVYKNGIEVVTEYRKEILPNFELGGGVAVKRAKNDSTPLYEQYKKTNPAPTDKFETVKPYVKAKLGYAFNKGVYSYELKKGNLEMKMETKYGDGVYLGLGTGVEIKNFVVDLSYNSTNMRTSTDIKNVVNSVPKEPKHILSTVKNHSVTLSVGYLFKF